MPRDREKYLTRQREWRAKNREYIREKNREDYNKKRELSYLLEIKHTAIVSCIGKNGLGVSCPHCRHDNLNVDGRNTLV